MVEFAQQSGTISAASQRIFVSARATDPLQPSVKACIYAYLGGHSARFSCCRLYRRLRWTLHRVATDSILVFQRIMVTPRPVCIPDEAYQNRTGKAQMVQCASISAGSSLWEPSYCRWRPHASLRHEHQLVCAGPGATLCGQAHSGLQLCLCLLRFRRQQFSGGCDARAEQY